MANPFILCRLKRCDKPSAMPRALALLPATVVVITEGRVEWPAAVPYTSYESDAG